MFVGVGREPKQQLDGWRQPDAAPEIDPLLRRLLEVNRIDLAFLE